MPETEQSVFIQQLENEIENQLKEVLDIFQNLPESTLLQPSATGGWSIAQCFEHLNTYANFYIPKLLQKINQAPAAEEATIFFKHSWIGHYFITMMDPEKSTKRYKAIKNHRPSDISNPYEILAEFIHHMETLLELLNTAKTRHLQRIKTGTSISSFIKLNAGDTLWFLLIHNKRHLLQARKNLVMADV
jgi:hypothetical protein